MQESAGCWTVSGKAGKGKAQVVFVVKTLVFACKEIRHLSCTFSYRRAGFCSREIQ